MNRTAEIAILLKIKTKANACLVVTAEIKLDIQLALDIGESTGETSGTFAAGFLEQHTLAAGVVGIADNLQRGIGVVFARPSLGHLAHSVLWFAQINAVGNSGTAAAAATATGTGAGGGVATGAGSGAATGAGSGTATGAGGGGVGERLERQPPQALEAEAWAEGFDPYRN